MILSSYSNRCNANSNIIDEYNEKHIFIDAQMYLKLRKPKKVISLLNDVQHDNNLIYKYFYLAKAYLLDNNYTGAEDSIKMCIKIEPEDGRWYTRYAILQWLQDKFVFAYDYYKTAFDKGDRSKETYEGLASYYTFQENSELKKYIYSIYFVKYGLKRYPGSEKLKKLDRLIVVWLNVFVVVTVTTMILLIITIKLLIAYLLKKYKKRIIMVFKIVSAEDQLKI